MKRIHRMPFGAEPAGGDRTRFRLWAPTAQTVELVAEKMIGGGRALAHHEGETWMV